MRRYALATLIVVAMPCIAWPQDTLAILRARWNVPQAPFKIHGDTYYVGTRGLGAILVTSSQGHVLIDGALPEAAPLIANNVRSLGFKLADIKLILNTHVHFDHAGGIAELQRLTGAVVKASASSAEVLRSGAVGRDDPQYGTIPAIAPIADVASYEAGQVQRVGSIALTPHATPGHTPGGTTWSWRSCEAGRCVDIVYADSLNPISAPGYLYSSRTLRPSGQAQLEGSFAIIEKLPCDILLTPHPELSDLFGKLERRERNSSLNPFVQVGACNSYVAAHREKLRQRLVDEQVKQ